MNGSGFCLYSWQSKGPELARQIATTVADALGVTPVSVDYAVVTPPDAEGETLHLANMPWDEFVFSENPDATGEFSFEGTLSKGKFFVALSDGRFDNLSRISIAFDIGFASILADVENLIRLLVPLSRPAYGIAFPARTIFAASGYSRGMGSPLFANENPGLFQDDYRIGMRAKSFQAERLRMVYPLNLLNEQHLSLRIGKSALRDFITGDARNGRLTELPDATWLWTVESTRLQELNDEFGASGLLICWQPRPAKRRLP